MTETNLNIGSPVKDFVSSLIDGLESALLDKGYVTCPENQAHTKMELQAIATVENSGEGGAKILGLGGSLETSDSNINIQKVTVFIKKTSELDKEEEKA